jgi:MFS family permease
MGMGGIALFVSAAAIGGAISQYPLGRLSDRIDRRLIIALICLAGSSLSVFFVVADNHIATLFWGKPLFANVSGQAVLCILSLVYGALFYPIYSLSITHTNDHVAKHRYVEASSTNLFIWGIGASIGPFISAGMIGIIGNGGLFLFMSIVMLFIGLNSFYYFYQRHPFTKHVVSKENDLCAEGSPRIPETAAAAPSIQA